MTPATKAPSSKLSPSLSLICTGCTENHMGSMRLTEDCEQRLLVWCFHSVRILSQWKTGRVILSQRDMYPCSKQAECNGCQLIKLVRLHRFPCNVLIRRTHMDFTSWITHKIVFGLPATCLMIGWYVTIEPSLNHWLLVDGTWSYSTHVSQVKTSISNKRGPKTSLGLYILEFFACTKH